MIDTETIKRRKRNNQIKNGVLGLACTLILLVVGVSTYSRYTTTHSNELYVYNAGEYIDPNLIEEFEQETGIKVTYDVFETLEEMYPVIEAGGVNYDVVCPSDYMIQKMKENDLLAELNFDNIPNVKTLTRSTWKCPSSSTRKTNIPCHTPGEPSVFFIIRSSSKKKDFRFRPNGPISGIRLIKARS